MTAKTLSMNQSGTDGWKRSPWLGRKIRRGSFHLRGQSSRSSRKAILPVKWSLPAAVLATTPCSGPLIA